MPTEIATRRLLRPRRPVPFESPRDTNPYRSPELSDPNGSRRRQLETLICKGRRVEQFLVAYAKTRLAMTAVAIVCVGGLIVAENGIRIPFPTACLSLATALAFFSIRLAAIEACSGLALLMLGANRRTRTAGLKLAVNVLILATLLLLTPGGLRLL